MSSAKANCSACGAFVEVEVAAPFAGASLAVALCPACTAQHFQDEGGVVLTLRRDLEGARFPLGKITVTAGAVEALAEGSQHVVEFLARHVRGDWGTFGQYDQIHLTADEQCRGWEVTDDSGKINKSDLLNGRGRLMSQYTTSGEKRIWVITYLGGVGGTTVLLPDEY